jgi:hypothetical protein
MKELLRPQSKFVSIRSLFSTTPTWHFHVHELHAYKFESKVNVQCLHIHLIHYTNLLEKKQIATLNLNIENTILH